MFIILQGCQIVKHKSPFLACSFAVSRVCGPSVYLAYTSNLQVRLLSYAISYKTSHNSFVSRSVLERNPLSTSLVHGWGEFYASDRRSPRLARSQIYASLNVAAGVDVINDLGLDTLTLLVVTVLVVPAFKTIKASPVRIRSLLSQTVFFFLSLFFISILCLLESYRYGYGYFSTLSNDI